jgi:WD40 repeat protein
MTVPILFKHFGLLIISIFCCVLSIVSLSGCLEKEELVFNNRYDLESDYYEPTAPTLSSTRVVVGGVDLVWSPNSLNGRGFKIERRDSANGMFNPIATVDQNARTYRDIVSLKQGVLVSYRICALGTAKVTSHYSNVLSITLIFPAPYFLGLSSVSTDVAILYWEHDNAYAQSFEIERAEGSGSYSRIATIGSGYDTYFDSTANKNSIYAYRLRAVSANNTSNYSPVLRTQYVSQPYSVARTFYHGNSSKYSVAISPDKRTIAMGGNAIDYIVRISSGAYVCMIYQGYSEPIVATAFARSYGYIITATPYNCSLYDYLGRYIYRNQKQVPIYKVAAKQTSDIFAVCTDNEVSFHNSVDGILQRALTGLNQARAFTFSGDENKFAVGDSSGVVTIYNYLDFSVLGSIASGITKPVDVSFVGNSNNVIAANSMGKITMFNYTTGESVWGITSTQVYKSFGVSEDGSILAAGTSMGVVECRSTIDGSLQKSIQAHTGNVNQVRFVPKDNIFMTVGDDQKATIYAVNGYWSVIN